MVFNCMHFLKYSLIRVAKDERFERLPCMHTGTYADDCIINRITQVNKCILKLNNSLGRIQTKKL